MIIVLLSRNMQKRFLHIVAPLFGPWLASFQTIQHVELKSQSGLSQLAWCVMVDDFLYFFCISIFSQEAMYYQLLRISPS